MNMQRNALTTFSCLILGAIALPAQDLTITNARIIGANGMVIERGSIVVRAGKIASVAAGAPSSASGKTINAKGMTALPGFIDAHKHINTGPDEKAQMQSLLEPATPRSYRAAGRATAALRCGITLSRE